MSDHCDLVSELPPTEAAGLWNECLTLSLHIEDHPLVVGDKGQKCIQNGIRFISGVDYHMPPQVL